MKQPDALEIMKMGHNIFLTGPAGCGKTFLLNKYVNFLKKNGITVGITASTGIAATHIDGRTIHSWCGIGISEEISDKHIKLLEGKKDLRERLMSSSVLVIDEISMLSADRLDMVDYVCKVIRKDMRPFGGLQIILCGDFFQLPPVARGGQDSRFVLDSEVWKDMDIKICYLEDQYRQDDTNFLKVLNDIRNNSVTVETKKIINGRVNKSVGKKIKPTKLYTHNRNVDAENLSELKKLRGSEMVYEMRSDGDSHLVEGLKKACLSPELLKLKVGAVVMFVKNNFNKGYVNGTLGKVVDFDGHNGNPVVETLAGDRIVADPARWVVEEGDVDIAFISQIPLRLAWAITVHKSQGMSLDCAEIDLRSTFEYGMGYVALSRVRSLSGIKLMGINKMALEVNRQVSALDKKLLLISDDDLVVLNKVNKQERKKVHKEFIKKCKNKDRSNIFETLS